MVDLVGRLSNRKTPGHDRLDYTIRLRESLACLSPRLIRALELLPLLLQQAQAGKPEAVKLQRQRRLSKDEVAQLASDYKAGKTVRELAELYHIHRTTVMDHLRRSGIPKQAPKLTREQIAQAKYMRNLGVSYAKIGKIFGVDAETITRKLKRYR